MEKPKENPQLRTEFANLQFHLKNFRAIEQNDKQRVARLTADLKKAKSDLYKSTKDRREYEKKVRSFWTNKQAKAWRENKKRLERADPPLP